MELHVSKSWKKNGEARKTAPKHCVEFQSNSFFRFRCCHYTSICKYADIFEPTQSEQEFSAKMNISAIFDSAISVCIAFFQILKLRTVFVCVSLCECDINKIETFPLFRMINLLSTRFSSKSLWTNDYLCHSRFQVDPNTSNYSLSLPSPIGVSHISPKNLRSFVRINGT